MEKPLHRTAVGVFSLLVASVGFKPSLAEKQKQHLPKEKVSHNRTFG